MAYEEPILEVTEFDLNAEVVTTSADSGGDIGDNATGAPTD